MTREWLLRGMLAGKPDAAEKADEVLAELADHALTLSHARHLSAAKCKSLGLQVVMLEDNHKLQEVILSVHHAFIHTLSATGAYKIIENHKGVAFIQMAQTVVVQGAEGQKHGISEVKSLYDD